MAVICRLLQIAPAVAEGLSATSGSVAQAIASSEVYSGVYRYWDGIAFLLARHRPGSVAGLWRELGKQVSSATERVPGARVISPGDVAALDRELQAIQPEDLADHYDAAALDEAGISPRCWMEWEETFDPLGQVLEHYTFLQFSTKGCAEAGNALLVYYEDNNNDD